MKQEQQNKATNKQKKTKKQANKQKQKQKCDSVKGINISATKSTKQQHANNKTNKHT